MRFRVRYPDGKATVLSDVSGTTPLSALLARVAAHTGTPPAACELLVAGPPPRVLSAPPGAHVSSVLRDGDTLLVRRAGAPAGGVARGRVGRAPRARRKSFRGAGRGRSLAGGEDAGDVDGGDGPRGAADALGARLLSAVCGGGGGGAKAFRKTLRQELAARQRRAVGEERYAAVLGGRYAVEYFRVDGEVALLFRARYSVGRREVVEPGGEEEYFGALSRRTVAESLRYLLDGAGEGQVDEMRERVRPAAMATVSVRLFWNVVRLVGKDVEAGLRELVPDGDWRFLRERKRTLSEKARRNAAQAHDEGSRIELGLPRDAQ